MSMQPISARKNEELPDVPGIAVPEIFLPACGLDLYRWAVIACDQHTAETGYWQETAAIVGRSSSSLHLILPELYLEHPAGLPVSRRIGAINQTMCRYLQDGVLRALEPGCMLVDRRTPQHASRKGLVLAVDLDAYDFIPGNRQLIRATEGTVLERIPPRAAIRRDATLELPHVQLLIDDPGCTVIEPLFAELQDAQPEPLYQTPLMQQGGSIRAWQAPAGSGALRRAFQALARLDSLQKQGLLMVVGDGNHSLATAKTHWQALRGQVGPDHPARYALAEVINLHDRGLAFEPIHRSVANLSSNVFLEMAAAHYAGQSMQILPPAGATADPAGSHRIPMITAEGRRDLLIGQPAHALAAGTLQDFLDDLTGRTDARVDYIHGTDVVMKLAQSGQIGLLLPALDKFALFPGIAGHGILPRKTFSMGEANEKRYYMECRKIR